MSTTTNTSSTGGTTGSGSTEVKPAKVDLGLLEEDDEFEEFPSDDYNKNGEDEEEVKVWEDNWDDDNIEDDFSCQLKAELEKQGFLDKDGTGK
ncbi:26S proteasome complex subunit SEM1 [Folsomia candida]|uniref:26S proteasome complex subunit SEM1 n=1 Tax=Folsomia candida TaxID=158441 RepID=UPI000B904C5B|nr:26S proteasome complex subunit SEM1 [Folsomia candida]